MKNPRLVAWLLVEDFGCGRLMDPHDAKGIADAIEYLLTHSEEAQQMGSRWREAIERHYNWNTGRAAIAGSLQLAVLPTHAA